MVGAARSAVPVMTSTLITSDPRPIIPSSSSTSPTESLSAAPATTRSNRAGLERAVARLGHDHGCLTGCPACEVWFACEGVPDPIERWTDFARSGRAIRLAQAARSGVDFPRLSPDEVTQFLIEEAAFTALDVFQSQERAKASEESARGENLEAMARRAVGR